MSGDASGRLRHISAGAITASLGIFVSRISGLVRDIAFARIYGTSDALGAFLLAFTAPNMLRSLFGEGAMNEAFVPLFNRHLENEGKERAFRLFNTIVSVLTVVLCGVVGIVAAVCLALRPLAADNIGRLTLELLPALLPYAVFICLAAFLAGVLNSFGYFAAPAWSSVLLNVALVVGALWLCPLLGSTDADRIWGLVVAVLVSGVLQLAMLAWVLRRTGFTWEWRPDFRSDDVRTMWRLLVPGLGGAAVYQVNVMTDRVMAGMLGGGAITALYYSERLIYLPVGVFAVALSTAVIPVLSRAYAKGDDHQSLEALLYAGRHVLYLSVPCVLVLVLLGNELVDLAFRRGAFTSESVLATTDALLYYAPGIPAFAAMKIVRSGFVSRHDLKTPLKVSILCMLINATLNWVLMGPLQVRGLALATTVSQIVNVTILTIILTRTLRPERAVLLTFIGHLLRQVVALAVAAGVLLLLRHVAWTWLPTSVWIARLIGLAITIAAAAVAFIGTGVIIRSPEPRELLGLVTRRRSARPAVQM